MELIAVLLVATIVLNVVNIILVGYRIYLKRSE
jgi:hypothetical protein